MRTQHTSTHPRGERLQEGACRPLDHWADKRLVLHTLGDQLGEGFGLDDGSSNSVGGLHTYSVCGCVRWAGGVGGVGGGGVGVPQLSGATFAPSCWCRVVKRPLQQLRPPLGRSACLVRAARASLRPSVYVWGAGKSAAASETSPMRARAPHAAHGSHLFVCVCVLAREKNVT